MDLYEDSDSDSLPEELIEGPIDITTAEGRVRTFLPASTSACIKSSTQPSAQLSIHPSRHQSAMNYMDSDDDSLPEEWTDGTNTDSNECSEVEYDDISLSDPSFENYMDDYDVPLKRGRPRAPVGSTADTPRNARRCERRIELKREKAMVLAYREAVYAGDDVEARRLTDILIDTHWTTYLSISDSHAQGGQTSRTIGAECQVATVLDGGQIKTPERVGASGNARLTTPVL